MPLFDWKCNGCGFVIEDFTKPSIDHLDPASFNPNKDPGVNDYCFGEFEKQTSCPGAFVMKGVGTYDKGFVKK